MTFTPRWLADMPLAFIGNVISRPAHHGGDVWQVDRQRHLRILIVRHVLFEGVLDSMLGREVAGEERGPTRGAHAGAAEGVLE